LILITNEKVEVLQEFSDRWFFISNSDVRGRDDEKMMMCVPFFVVLLN
jgi:hypothetical protein